jgi:hypothetical protein
LLYNIFAARHGYPALHNEPVYREIGEHATHLPADYFHLPSADELGSLAEGVSSLLEPRRFTESLPQGRAGVAVLDEDEVAHFLRNTPQGDVGNIAKWWEFLPLEDKTYALFPNDAFQVIRFEILLPVRVRSASYQLRRFNIGLTVDPKGRVEQGAATLDTDLCQSTGTTVDELPYEGTCEGEECGTGCTDVVHACAEDGTYYLAGCECPVEDK